MALPLGAMVLSAVCDCGISYGSPGGTFLLITYHLPLITCITFDPRGKTMFAIEV